jgi:cell division protein FtsB
MEVHHHPDLHHNRKKFKEYLLEFVMIFLAVSLGFLAESLREGIGDREKERQYIVSLVNDLRADTSNITQAIDSNMKKMDSLTAMISLSRKNLADEEVRKSLYRFTALWVGRYYMFGSQDATMMQLKNGGGLRLIRRDHVADSIALYDNEIKDVLAAGELYREAFVAGLDAAEQIIDYTAYNDPAYEDVWHGAPKVLLPLVTEDPQKIHLFYNKIDFEIGATRNYINNMKDRLPIMVRLIGFLQREYDLE